MFGPGQYSQQCCEYWSVGIGLIELFHSPWVGRRDKLISGILLHDQPMRNLLRPPHPITGYTLAAETPHLIPNAGRLPDLLYAIRSAKVADSAPPERRIQLHER
jgi:hypothetical protein